MNMPQNKYLTILESAWQDHLKPKDADAPTVISLFAGCGGSSLGYSMAGFRELLAVEWDKNACETFHLNFPDVCLYAGDIASLTVQECLDMTGLKPGELDILDGSPPCQGFSTAGKRVMEDPRNSLFKEYARLLQGLRPKVFVMENVSGMVKGKMKIIFAEILRELKASGYKVSARLLNAMYFNVPQSRQRMIFVGVRKDLGIEPSHPKAEGKSFTVREAWYQCPIMEPPRLSPKLASIIHDIPIYGDGGDILGSFYSTKRLDFNRPSRTVIKGNIGTRACYVHPSDDRAITETEMMRIMSFPDKYKFIGGYKKSVERMGNSVPPLFMRSIASHIKQELLCNEVTT
jgi:DNA (cytosine-5)-methyltransferase 1